MNLLWAHKTHWYWVIQTAPAFPGGPGIVRPVLALDETGQSMAMNYPLVCVGGSAVEIDTYKELLGDLPADLGIAIVIIDNLNTVPNLLQDALPKYTAMPVEWITDGMR
jgi:hypothetical protein